MGGTTKYWDYAGSNLGLSHASRQYGSLLLMLQPCPRNGGPATLEWNSTGLRKRGRPAHTWETALQKCCVWKSGDNWIVEAAANDHWMRSGQVFVFFRLYTGWPVDLVKSSRSFACALKGLWFDFSLRNSLIAPTFSLNIWVPFDKAAHSLPQWKAWTTIKLPKPHCLMKHVFHVCVKGR